MNKILGVKRPLKMGVKRPGCETTGNRLRQPAPASECNRCNIVSGRVAGSDLRGETPHPGAGSMAPTKDVSSRHGLL